MEILQIGSIALEAVIVLIALAIGIGKKKCYGWGFALTFGIYVYYDLARYMNWQAFASLLPTLFFVATLSAALSMVALLKKS